MNEQPKYTSACLEAEQLVAWFDDALPAEEAHAVQMHLETCAYCTRHVNELLEERQQVFNLLAQLDPPSMKGPTLTTAAFALFQEHVSQSGNYNVSLESTPFTRLRGERPRFRRVAIQTLVAALILTVLVGTVLSLLLPRVASPASPQEPFPPLSTTPVTVSTEAGGLSMTMKLTAGPYFLNEMLQVDLSISNHSSTTYPMRVGKDNPCIFPLQVELSGGTPSADTTLLNNLHDTLCRFPFRAVGIPSSLKPGDTLAKRLYVVLKVVGHIQLAARFMREVVIPPDGVEWLPVSTPLMGHWPTVALDVSPHIPAQRNLLLKQQNMRVTVVAPPTTHPQLLYIELFVCSHAGDQRVQYWTPLPKGTSTLQPPPCDTSSPPLGWVSWTYAIGAPGFATRSGTYSAKT